MNQDMCDILKGLREPTWKFTIPMSDCCKAECTIGGEGLTHYFVCSKCLKACDEAKDE